MSDKPTERDMEAVSAEERAVLLRVLDWGIEVGQMKPKTALLVLDMVDRHAERIAQARREGAAEVTERVNAAIAGVTVQNENRAYAPIVVIREDALRAALRGDS